MKPRSHSLSLVLASLLAFAGPISGVYGADDGLRSTDSDRRTAPGNTGPYTGGTNEATRPAGTTAGRDTVGTDVQNARTTTDTTSTSMSSTEYRNEATDSKTSAAVAIAIVAAFALLVGYLVYRYRQREDYQA